MPIYRAYTQPDNPAVYGAISLDAPEEDVKFTPELRTACLLAAGPKPRAPPVCPRCHEVGATFKSRVCYKFGIAGAWNMLCNKCKLVHMPTQVGPTEVDLEGIETIRDRDRQAERARKDAKKRERAKKKSAKEKKTSARTVKAGTKTGDVSPATSDQPNKRARRAAPAKAKNKTRSDNGALDTHQPFGTISNAIRVPADHARESNALSASALKADQHGSPITATHPVRTKRSFQALEAIDPEVRTMVLVLWETAGQDPFTDRVTVPTRDKLFLFHHPHVRAIPPPTQFERYVFSGNVWSEVPWDISPIEVDPEDNIIFIRVMGIQCRGFGQQLHDYQVDRGHGLPLQQRLAHVIYHPPKRHRWVLVWDEDRAPPKIFLFDSRVLDEEQDHARVPRPWLELLRDAPFLLIWHELHTRWRGVFHHQSSELPDDSPIVLLAHPGVETLLGSGEAIAWLEAWRVTHKLALPESAAVDVSRAEIQAASPPDRVVPNRTYSKKRPSYALLHTRASSSADDALDLDAHGATTPRARALTRTGRRAKGAHMKESALNAVINISDDEAEFIQGSSSSPMKSQKAEREVIDLTEA